MEDHLGIKGSGRNQIGVVKPVPIDHSVSDWMVA